VTGPLVIRAAIAAALRRPSRRPGRGGAAGARANPRRRRGPCPEVAERAPVPRGRIRTPRSWAGPRLP